MINILIAFGPAFVVCLAAIFVLFRRLRARRKGSRQEQQRVEILLNVFRRSQHERTRTHEWQP